MSAEVKSGKELIDGFFEELKKSDLDQTLVKMLSDLHSADQLTNKSITNALQKIREEAKTNANKKD